ncbi:MAG: hypothetical protein EBS38_08840, partial [Actinobacteria bacterium]|nr:hypothetical protein [Actinomycetota bacterium]
MQLQRELFDLQAQSQDLERNSGLERLRRSQEALQASIPQLQQRREAAISQGLPQETIAQFDSLLKQTQERIAANAEAEKQITDAIKAQSEAIQKQIQLREEQYRRAQQQAVFEAQQRNFSIGRETVQQRIQGLRSRQFDFGALGEANQAEFDLRQGELMSQLDTQMRDYQEQLRQLRIQQDVMPTAETQAQIDLLNETIERTKELNAATLENYRSEFEQNTRAIEQQRRALDNELVSSQMAPIRERSSGLRAMGFETQAMGIDRELAIVDIQQELSNTLADIQSRAGLSAEAVAQLTNNAHALAQVKLDNVSQQFSIMGQLLPGIQQGFQGFFTGLLTGSQSLEEAFKGMVDTILNQVAQLASQMLVNELLGGLFGMGGG